MVVDDGNVVVGASLVKSAGIAVVTSGAALGDNDVVMASLKIVLEFSSKVLAAIVVDGGRVKGKAVVSCVKFSCVAAASKVVVSRKNVDSICDWSLWSSGCGCVVWF